jgi:hypothetical protein
MITTVLAVVLLAVIAVVVRWDMIEAGRRDRRESGLGDDDE